MATCLWQPQDAASLHVAPQPLQNSSLQTGGNTSACNTCLGRPASDLMTTEAAAHHINPPQRPSQRKSPLTIAVHRHERCGIHDGGQAHGNCPHKEALHGVGQHLPQHLSTRSAILSMNEVVKTGRSIGPSASETVRWGLHFEARAFLLPELEHLQCAGHQMGGLGQAAG